MTALEMRGKNVLMRCNMRCARGYWSVDEMRRAIESLAPSDYLSFTYYQKWLAALHLLVKEKGVLSQIEIDRRVASLRAETNRR